MQGERKWKGQDGIHEYDWELIDRLINEVLKGWKCSCLTWVRFSLKLPQQQSGFAVV